MQSSWASHTRQQAKLELPTQGVRGIPGRLQAELL